MYLADYIGDDFKTWGKGKILINAPTGVGKTTFIIKKLLPYYEERGKKILILCNRRLLRHQYWSDLVNTYTDFEKMNRSVDLMMYQQLAEMIQVTDDISTLLMPYEVVVADEMHYFYSDADFNGYGTYALLQAMIYAGLGKQMPFLSATMNEVTPLIKNIIWDCYSVATRVDGVNSRA